MRIVLQDCNRMRGYIEKIVNYRLAETAVR